MSTQLNTTKYMELENIFQYSVRPELNMDFKTCCIVLDKSKLDTSAKYIIQVFKKYISTEIAQNVDVTTYLKDVSAKLASDDIEESHVTLQVSGGNDHNRGMLNIILLTYDADLLITRSLYRFNESLRGVGGHIYNSLHKNELRNFNLIVPGENKMCDDYLLKVLEGFLLAMYSFNKYKSGNAGEKKELPEFRDQVLNTIKLRDTKTKKAGLVMGGAVENKQTKILIGELTHSSRPHVPLKIPLKIIDTLNKYDKLVMNICS
jgi:leucyl aminopeptidase